MRKTIGIKVCVLLSLCIFIACSDEHKDPLPEISKGQEQLNKMILELEKQENVSSFTAALKGLKDVNIEEDRLTLFAVKNKETRQATAGTRSSDLTEATLKRHIAKGSYDLKNSDLSKPIIALSITNDTLIITKKDGEYFVNGIAVDSSREPILVGNSYVYVVNDVIPDIKEQPRIKEYKVLFTISECNPSWSETNYQPTIKSDHAYILILEKRDESVFLAIDSLATGADGTATYTHDGSKQLYYTVLKGKQSLLSDGFFVYGSLTSDAQVEEAFERYDAAIRDALVPPYLGGPALVDLNGDGKISAADRVASDLLPITYTSEDEVPGVFTANHCLTPAIQWLPAYIKAKATHADWVYDRYMFQFYNEIDDYLVRGEADYPSLKKTEEMGGSLIRMGMTTIENFITADSLFHRNDCPPAIKTSWRRDPNTQKMRLETLLVQSMLRNFYGEQPIFSKRNMDSREADEYMIAQLDELIEDGVYQYPSMALKGRILLKNKNWEAAVNAVNQIIHSNRYTLSRRYSADQPDDEEEVLLGGYNSSERKGWITNPIRYPEILLTISEASVELGRVEYVIPYINQLNYYVGKEEIHGNLTAEQARTILRELWSSIYDKEGLSLWNLKRWDIFDSTLGNQGAKSHNQLLPVPGDIIIRYGWKQNPGY